METHLSPRLPETLLETLFQSDPEKTSALSAEERREARNWLRQLIVDYDSLESHLAHLQKLDRESFHYERPDPFQEKAYRLPVFEERSRYKYREPLSDEQIASVADKGLDALSDGEVAKLLLNPVALLDLYRVIDELNPEAWHAAFHDAGMALLPSTGTAKEVATAPALPKIAARRNPLHVWPAGILAVAATLFIGVVIGSRSFRETREGSARSDWSAEATYVVKGTRGPNELGGIEIKSNLNGFATVIVLFPADEPVIMPRVRAKLIPVKPGESVESPPLPTPRLEPALALIVVTSTPSVTEIHRALQERNFSTAEVKQLRAFLEEKLHALNYRDIAFTEAALPVTEK